MCPRSDTHHTYTVNIALTTEFAIPVGGACWRAGSSCGGRREYLLAVWAQRLLFAPAGSRLKGPVAQPGPGENILGRRQDQLGVQKRPQGVWVLGQGSVEGLGRRTASVKFLIRQPYVYAWFTGNLVCRL
jgi:hypothetical protein